MKKVGKEFRKSLSAILAASMVMGSMPQTSLMVNAEEAEPAVETEVETAEETIAENEAAPEENGDGIEENGAVATAGLKTSTITVGGRTLDVTASVSYKDIYDNGTQKGQITVSDIELSDDEIDALDYYNVEIDEIEYVDAAGADQKISSLNDTTYTDASIKGLKNQDIKVKLKATLKSDIKYYTATDLIDTTDTNVVFNRVKYYIGTTAPTALTQFKAASDVLPGYYKNGSSNKDTIYVYVPDDAFADGYELADIAYGDAPTSIKSSSAAIGTTGKNAYKVDLNTLGNDKIALTAAAITTFDLTIAKADTDSNISKIQYKYGTMANFADVTFSSTTGTIAGVPVNTEVTFKVVLADGKSAGVTATDANATENQNVTFGSGENILIGTYTVKAADTVTFTAETNKYYVNAITSVANGAASAIAPSAFKVNDTNYTTGTAAGNTTITKGQTVEFTVTDVENTVSSVVAYKADDAETEVALTKEADGEYSFAMPDFNVAVKVTTDTKTKLTFDNTSGGNANVSSIAWGTKEETATTGIGTLSETTSKEIVSDAESDFYFTIQPKTGFKVTAVTLASQTVTQVSDTVWKIAQNTAELAPSATIANAALAVTTAEVTNETIAVAKDANVDVYYKFAASASAPTSKTGMTKVSGTTIAVPDGLTTEKLYVYAEVPTAKQSDYMLSSLKLNGKSYIEDGTTEITEAAPDFIDAETFATSVIELDKPEAGTSWAVDVKTEALAYDYTFTWPAGTVATAGSNGTAYKITVDEDTVVKQMSGNGTFIVGNSTQVSSADQVDLVVRVLKDKDLKFKVESTAETDEVDPTTVTVGVNTATNWGNYYTIASASTGGTIVANTKAIAAESVGLKVVSATAGTTGISKIVANVDSNGKRTTNDDNKQKVNAPAHNSTPSLSVFPGTVATVNIDMDSNNFYVVDKIEYNKKDGSKVVLKGATSFNIDLDDIAYTGTADITITTKVNEAVSNKVVFDYDHNNVTITPSTGETFKATEKTASMLPDASTAAATGNSLTFGYTANNGYTVKKITIGDKTYEGAELAALGTSGITVDFEKTEKTEDNVTTYISKSGQTINVIIETEAPANTADRRFAVTNGGNSKVSYQVKTAGVTSYTKTVSGVTTTYYDIDKDSEINEVELVAIAPKGYTISMSDTISDAQGIQTVSNEENTVTYKIITSKLAAVSADGTPEKVTLGATANTYTFNLTGAVTAVEEDGVTLDIPANGRTYNFDEEWKVQLKSYETLEVRKANDASGNAVWEAVSKDEDNIALISMANIIDIDDDGTIAQDDTAGTGDGVYYRVVNKAYDALKYTLGATVAGDDVDAPTDGLLKTVTVKGGETVGLKVTYKHGSSSNHINIKDIPALDTAVYKSTIGALNNAVDTTDYDDATITINTDARDAGKTIKVPVINIVTDANGVQSEAQVAEFEIVIAGRATEASVEGVKDDKLDLTVGQRTVLGLTLDKSIAEEVVDGLLVINGTGKLNNNISFFVNDDGTRDLTKLVFDTTTLKADEKSTVTVKCDGKTLTSFEVTGVAPKMAVKSVASPSQSYNYINVTVVPETIVRSTDTLNNAGAVNQKLFYEFKVSPVSGNAASSTTQYIYKEVAGKTDAEAKTFTAEGATYKLDVNNVAIDAAKVGAYDVEVRMVVGTDALAEATSTSVSTNVLAGSVVDSSLKGVSTKLPYVEDNLTVAKKSAKVVANQRTLVNTVKYSDNTSYVGNLGFRVLNADGTLAWSSATTGNEIDLAGNVYVQAPGNTQPGKYTVEISSETAQDDSGNDMVASVATFTLTVKNGMSYFTVPEISSVYLKSGKKATASFKAKGYGSYDYAKEVYRVTDDQKFIYTVETANKENADKVSIDKSGKLTIAKDFVMSNSKRLNQVTVKVKAKNFDLSEISRVVEVTQEKMEIASIELIGMSDGKNLGTSVDYDTIKNGAGVTVVIKDAKGNQLGLDDVTVTPSSGNVYAYVRPSDGRLMLGLKNGKTPKSVTIKAVAKDGGKNSKSVKFALGCKTDGKLDLAVTDDGYTSIAEPTNNNFTIAGNGKLITFNVFDGDDHQKLARKDIYNYAVKIKGGTLVKDADANDASYTFTQTAKNVTITITDNAKKPKVVSTYTIDNTNYVATKAPKFKLVKGMKLYAGVDASQKLKYDVTTECTWAKINQVSYSDKYSANLVSDLVEVKDGQFEMEYNNTTTNRGTIKYEVVFGNKDASGDFVAATKPAKLSVSLAKQAKVVPQTSYTVYYDSTAAFEFKASPDYDVQVVEVLNDNVKGKYNNFAKYFAQNPGTNVIELQPAVIAANGKVTTDINELVPEADRTGYISYRYHLSTGWVTKKVKVTVDFSKDGKLDGTVKADPTLSGAIVYAYGELVDANGDPIDISSVYSTGDWAVTKYATNGANAVQFRSTKAVVGDNTVTFKVLTNKSYYSAYPAATAEKYGAEVTATIKVLDADTATGKLETKTDGAAIDLAGDTATQSWTVKTATSGVGTYTNYVKLEDVFENVNGATKDVKNINNLKITRADAVDTEGVTAQLSQVGGEYVVELSVDQDKLKAGETSNFDVKFSFDNSKAAETVTFAVKAPAKFLTLSDVAAELKTELAACNYTDDITAGNISTKVNTMLNAYKATGITLVSSSVEAPTAPDTIYTAKVKIKSILDTTGDTAIDIEAALKPQGSKKALANEDAAYDALLDIMNLQIKDEVFKDTATYVNAEDQSDYLIVTASTTREDIKAFIQKEINEYTNGSEYTVTVPVNGFSKQAAQNYESGEIKAKAYITKGSKTSDPVEVTYKTAYLKYVSPTTPTP